MALELYRIPILKYPLAYLTSFWAKIFLGIDLKKSFPAESAKILTIPVLVIHSKTMRLYRSKTRFSSKSLKITPKQNFGFPPKADPPLAEKFTANSAKLIKKDWRIFLNNL